MRCLMSVVCVLLCAAMAHGEQVYSISGLTLPSSDGSYAGGAAISGTLIGDAESDTITGTIEVDGIGDWPFAAVFGGASSSVPAFGIPLEVNWPSFESEGPGLSGATISGANLRAIDFGGTGYSEEELEVTDLSIISFGTLPGADSDLFSGAVSFAAVPEPCTSILGGLGALCLLGFRRIGMHIARVA